MTVEVDIHVNDELCFNKYMARSGKPSANDAVSLFADMIRFFGFDDLETAFITDSLLNAVDYSTGMQMIREGVD